MYQLPKILALELEDGVEILTWIQCRPSGLVNSNNEMRDNNCIQYACNPFVLPRYSVSSGMIKVSERVQIGEKKLRPLSQYNLGYHGNERVVHNLEGYGFLAPAIPGSIT